MLFFIAAMLLLFQYLAIRQMRKRKLRSPSSYRLLLEALPGHNIEHVAIVFAIIIFLFSLFPYTHALAKLHPDVPRFYHARAGEYAPILRYVLIGGAALLLYCLQMAIEKGKIPFWSNLILWSALELFLVLLTQGFEDNSKLNFAPVGVIAAFSLDRMARCKRQLATT